MDPPSVHRWKDWLCTESIDCKWQQCVVASWYALTHSSTSKADSSWVARLSCQIKVRLLVNVTSKIKIGLLWMCSVINNSLSKNRQCTETAGVTVSLPRRIIMVTYYGDIGFTRQDNLAHVMEHFLYPLDLSHTSLSKRTHRKHLRQNLEGDWANCSIWPIRFVVVQY